ncbi:MAG TPA: ABC transporter ATP-binding protein [Methylomirabilota bacterium]|nr:ABC transporter ATP-binding protein [Methylomirabilota bacterium]
MSSLKNYPTRQFIQDLAVYIAPYKIKFSLGVFFRLTSDIGQLYPAYALSQIIPLLGKLHDTSSVEYILLLLVVWALTAIYVGIGHDFSKYLGYQVAESSALDLYKKCLSHIFKLDLAWHEIEGSGNKMKKIDRGMDSVNGTIRRIFDVLIEVLVNTIGIVLIFFSLDKGLSISIIFFIITFFLLGKYLLRRASRQEQVVNTQFEDLSGTTFESLNNILTIKSLAFDQGIMRVVNHQTKALVGEIRKRIFYYRFQSGALSSYYLLFEVGLVSFIIWGIFHGVYSVSILVLFVGLFEKVGQSTSELVGVTQELVVNKIWFLRATNLLQVNPVIENPSKQLTQLAYPVTWQKLRIVNVHFAYEKGQALTGISFDIKRGESVGIVGLSGAGKSTLFKLLLDLYEDYEGKISLDGSSLKQIDRQSYIDHVSVVLQDTELFNMSLGENITIAEVQKNANTSVSLKETVRLAHLEDVVNNLPEGINTIVGEKGIKLSGGQRQRVGIARALYRQPDILLLDEATSHLDAHSEKQIQQAIADVKGNYTTIVIAHRLSTIQQMDKIVVLEKGKIKEIGTFNELLEKKGSFAHMWKMQKL